MALPMPLGTALSQPLLPATPSDLVQPHLSSLQSNNNSSNFLPNSNSLRSLISANTGNHERSFTNPTSTHGSIQSMIQGFTTSGPLPNPQSPTSHLNINSSTSNSHLSAGVVGGGNPNSLAVVGSRSSNHLTGT